MRKPRSSGFLETLVKAAFGSGTTVHHSRGLFGAPKKVVAHHDSGKSKTISQRHGFWGNITRTEKRHRDTVVETSTRERRFWGGHAQTTQHANGNQVDSEHRPGFFRSHGAHRQTLPQVRRLRLLLEVHGLVSSRPARISRPTPHSSS